jgi:hypothetical protein
MQEWASDSLWQKARLYCEHAFEADPNGPLFPLFASFAIEFLGKAALSKIHPALIADPRDEGKGILYAFGVPTKTPHTIMAKTVFSRLTQLVDEFSDEDEKACLLMAERRNRELHTGEAAYAGHKTGQWLPEFYRVIKILSDFMGRDIVDLVGKDQASEAIEITTGETKRIISEVERRMNNCKKSIGILREKELADRRGQNRLLINWQFLGNDLWTKKISCPVYSSESKLTLRHLTDRPAQIFDGAIYVESLYSPKRFDCPVCDLSLVGTAELRVAGLADYITDCSESDPIEYFDIDIEAQDLTYGDYGNE